MVGDGPQIIAFYGGDMACCFVLFINHRVIFWKVLTKSFFNNSAPCGVAFIPCGVIVGFSRVGCFDCLVGQEKSTPRAAISLTFWAKR